MVCRQARAVKRATETLLEAGVAAAAYHTASNHGIDL